MPEARVGDIQIYYEQYGKGEPLIMILGLGQDIATWGFQISQLSEYLNLIVFDNRDAGRSCRCTKGYTTEDMAQDAVGIMDHLEIKRAHILGTSLGGMIAQQMALISPEKIGKMILASSTISGEG